MLPGFSSGLFYSFAERSSVAPNLNKMEHMHSRLQSNLEAIGMLNQQVSVCMHKRTPGPDGPFSRQIQTQTHTPAHLLLSSRTRGGFQASNFKHVSPLTQRRTQTSISSSYDKSKKSAVGRGVQHGGGCGENKSYRGKSSDVSFLW